MSISVPIDFITSLNPLSGLLFMNHWHLHLSLCSMAFLFNTISSTSVLIRFIVIFTMIRNKVFFITSTSIQVTSAFSLVTTTFTSVTSTSTVSFLHSLCHFYIHPCHFYIHTVTSAFTLSFLHSP